MARDTDLGLDADPHASPRRTAEDAPKNMCRRPLLGGPVHKLGANSVGRRRLKVGSQPVGAKATAFKLIQVSIVCLYAVYMLSTTCCLYAVYTLSMPLDSKVLSICC